MRKIIPVVMLFCSLGFSCEDENKTNPDFIIKTGRDCGWCGGSDSLVITEFKSHYVFGNPCDETKNKIKITETNRSEWNELLNTLNWEEFKKVNVNTCAVCADGCDTWILIQNQQMTHQIRFTENSPEIEPIRTFVEKLSVWPEAFR